MRLFRVLCLAVLCLSMAVGYENALAGSMDPVLDAACDDAFAFGKTRLDATVAYIKAANPSSYQNSYPYSTYTSGSSYGKWSLYGKNNWGTGFFPGTLWLMYEKTGDSTVLANAKLWTAGIASMQNTTLDDDMGFRVITSVYNAYQFSNDANDPGGVYRAQCKTAILNATASMDVLFNRGGIPVGAMPNMPLSADWEEPYPVYTDSIMNIRLYFEAWNLSGRPTSGQAKTWYDHGVSEANVILAQNMRTFAAGSPRAGDDGSTYHIVQYNDGQVINGRLLPANGSVYAKITNQGYGNESTWSRGQAWAIYGLADVYRCTKDDPSVDPGRFLAGSMKAADYFIAHLPNNYAADIYNYRVGDFVPPSDFDAALVGEPAGPYSTNKPALHTYTGRDSSAAAVAASGLFELSTLVTDPAASEKYFKAGEDILRCLLTYTGSDSTLDYLAKDSQHMGILAGASGSWVASNQTDSLIWGDYYFLEAMQRYQAMAIPGDANRDGKVSFADYVVLANNFGQAAASWRQGDFNADGRVTFADYVLLANNFGQGSVPEPATLTILLGAAFLTNFKRRR